MQTSPFRRGLLLPLLALCGCTTTAPPPACPKDDVKAGTSPTMTSTSPGAGPFKVLAEDKSPVTFDRMAVFPDPGWSVPRGVSFAPDKKSFVYLASESGGQEMALFSFD